MKLLIAIPALDEEDSIGSIVERTLAARAHILASSPVDDVEVIVVSDGSTDRTVEIARAFEPAIRLVVFPENRGYGAAIQTAWQLSDADLLSFLDADGTCDPLFFADLCRALEAKGADIALGNRMNPASRMPWIRRVGNRLFALLLGFLSSKRVEDTASGMRVVRRSALRRILPLPKGLHFTPAMSARAMLSDDLSITEVPMPYHERSGRSKLSVARDGLRFLRVILRAALLYRPSRPLGLLGLACLFAASALMLPPTHHYLVHRQVEGWMIYRFVVSDLAGSAGCLLLCAAYLAKRCVRLTLAGPGTRHRTTFFERTFSSRLFLFVPVACLVAGGLLVLPSFFQLVFTGATYLHWSRFIAMSFLWSVALTLLATRAVDYCFGLVADRLAYLEGAEGVDPG